jgi:protein SDA1
MSGHIVSSYPKQLLEDHLEKQRAEKGEEGEAMEEDDEAAWEGWELESDSSESSEGWQDVSSDGEDFEVSDSDDEKPKVAKSPAKGGQQEEGTNPKEENSAQRISTLATTKVSRPFEET